MIDFVEVQSKDALKTIHYFIANQKHGIAVCAWDEPVVMVPKAKVVDEALCYKLGYKVLETSHSGGVVVVSKGDFSVVHFGKPDNDFVARFSSHIVDWLNGKGLSATYEGNDILVDGCKICGTSRTRYSKIDYSTFSIGVDTNLDHIKAICTKPMEKVPKGLGEYGITTENVREMFLDFCNRSDTQC